MLLVTQITVLILSIKPNQDYIQRLEQLNTTSSQSSKVWKLTTYSVDGLIVSTSLVITIVVVCESYCALLVLVVPFLLFTIFLTVLTLVKAILYNKTMFVDVATVVLSLSASLSLLLFASILSKRATGNSRRTTQRVSKKQVSAPLLQTPIASNNSSVRKPSISPPVAKTRAGHKRDKSADLGSEPAMELPERREPPNECQETSA